MPGLPFARLVWMCHTAGGGDRLPPRARRLRHGRAQHATLGWRLMDTALERTRGGGNLPALVLFPLGHLAVEIYNTMLSVMWPFLAVRFGLTFGAIGLLGTLFRTTMTLPQLAFAGVADRRGSRGLGISGLAWMAAGMSLVGLAPSVPVLAILLFLAPLGSAAFHPAGTAYMSRLLGRRRGTAIAFFMIGGSLGSALGPLVGAGLYQRWGIGASPWLLPFGLLMAVAMAFAIPQDRPQTHARVSSAPSAAPIPPAVYALVAASVCVSWVENSIAQYLPLLYTGRNLPLSTASQALSAFSLAACGGILVGGILSDRMPRWQVVLLSQALTVPLHLGALLLGGPALILIPGALGFAAALSHPTVVALAQELMPERTSLAAALTMGGSWLLGSLGVLVAGFLADRIGMQRALLVNTAAPLVGMASILLVRRLMAQRAEPSPQWRGAP
ncbi:MAG: MFS transporter [Anaerolineae bacterium]